MVQVMARTTDLPRIEHLATKNDLVVTKAELQAAIANLERRLIGWVIGSGVVSAFGPALLRQIGLLD